MSSDANFLMALNGLQLSHVVIRYCFCPTGKFCMLFVVCRLFFKSFFFKNAIRVSNRLDPDQARQFVGPGLGPNCLQRFSADDTSRPRDTH